MKRIRIAACIALALLFLSPVIAFAAETEPVKAKAETEQVKSKSVNDTGVMTLQIGTGLGVNTLTYANYSATTFKGYSGFYVIPPIVLNFNVGIIDLVSVGILFGYEGCGLTDDFIYNLMIGARADFHFNRWIKVRGLDFYIGGVVGVNITSYTHVFPVDPTFGSLSISLTKTSVLWNAQAGIRYFFHDNVGVWLEAGYGYSIVSGGLIFKF
jgi:hypothetical protein